MKEILTRTECTAMKGIAILGIMLHNYCHWLKGITRENEYTWSQWKNDQLWAVFNQPDELLPTSPVRTNIRGANGRTISCGRFSISPMSCYPCILYPISVIMGCLSSSFSVVSDS